MAATVGRLLQSVRDITAKAWAERWSGYKWVSNVVQLLDAPAKSLPPAVSAALLKELLVGHLLVSPLIVSYLSHALATKLISIDAYVAALTASINSKAMSPSDSICVVQPTVLLLTAYEGGDIQRLAMEVFLLLLTSALHFARTLLQPARPAVSNGGAKTYASAVPASTLPRYYLLLHAHYGFFVTPLPNSSSANLESEWEAALSRLSDIQPAVSEHGLPLCVQLLATFETPRLMAALLEAHATSPPEKRQNMAAITNEVRTFSERLPHLPALRRLSLLTRVLFRPTLADVNELALPPAQPLLLTRTLSCFKLALSAALSSSHVFHFTDLGTLFDRFRLLHSLSHSSFFTHVLAALSTLRATPERELQRRALVFGVFPALFARWQSSNSPADASPLPSVVPSFASSPIIVEFIPYLTLLQLLPPSPATDAAVQALQAQVAQCNALEQQFNTPAQSVSALQHLAVLFTSAPHLQRRIGEFFIQHLEGDDRNARANVLALLCNDVLRDVLLSVMHIHGLALPLLGVLLTALEAAGNTAGVAAQTQFTQAMYLCAELAARHRLHHLRSTDALLRAVTTSSGAAAGDNAQGGKRARTSAGSQAQKWLLSFRISAPGGERTDAGIVDTLTAELRGAANSCAERLTPWQLWTSLPFALPAVLRSPNDAQALPTSFTAITDAAPYLVLRTAEWLQAELLTGVDSQGLAPWASFLIRSSGPSPLFGLFYSHIVTYIPYVLAPFPPPQLTHAPDPLLPQLMKILSPTAERCELDTAAVTALNALTLKFSSVTLALGLMECLFRPVAGLREELFGCTNMAVAESIAFILHLCAVPSQVLISHLSPLLAELDQQPRATQLALLLGTLAVLDNTYCPHLWSAALASLPRSLASPAEPFFLPLTLMLLGLELPPQQLRAAEATRQAGLERFALLAFDWNDAAARTQASAFFNLQSVAQ